MRTVLPEDAVGLRGGGGGRQGSHGQCGSDVSVDAVLSQLVGHDSP
jgi:hypothetical protein